MPDVLVVVYKRRVNGMRFYRFIIHFNKAKMTSCGHRGVHDFPTLFEFTESLKREVASTNEKVIAAGHGRGVGPPPGLRPQNIRLSREVPDESQLAVEFDGGARQPLSDDEFAAVQEALQDVVQDWDTDEWID